MKFLICGGGAVVTEYYLSALRLLDSLSNVLIIDISKSTIKALIKKVPDLKCRQKDFKEYITNFSEEETFDAAIIALPNHLHVEPAELVLLKGLNVLCEKPLAMDEEYCLRLDRLSKETGEVLADCWEHLSPGPDLDKEDVARKNSLGEVKDFAFRFLEIAKVKF